MVVNSMGIQGGIRRSNKKNKKGSSGILGGSGRFNTMEQPNMSATKGAEIPSAPAQPLSKKQKRITRRIESGKLNLVNDPQETTRKALRGFTGKAGRLTIDPATGKPVPYKQRLKPKQWLRQQRASGGAVEDAQNFEFDLPESGAGDAAANASRTARDLTKIGGGLLDRGAGQITAGQGTLNQGTGSLLGSIGALGNQAGVASGNAAAALEQLRALQETALDPTVSNPLFEENRQARLAEAQALESNLMDAFERQRASDLANLANRGVLDSSTTANTLAERDTRLGLALNQLFSNANEASRQEVLGERGRIDEAARAFGQNQSLQAAQQGGLAANLLGNQADAADSLGRLGLGQQGIGADLSRLGAGTMESGGRLGLGAGQLGLGNVNQLAQLQLAQLGQRLLGQQTGLGNLESLRNADLNRRLMREQMAYFGDLRDNAGGGFLGGLF